MKNWTTRTLSALLCAAVLLPAGAWAHPGHQHGSDTLAYLVHSLTSWGPLPLVMVLAVAAAAWLRKSQRR